MMRTKFTPLQASARQGSASKSVTGFTIIELIMTMVLVGIIASGSALSLSEMLRGTYFLRNRMSAVSLARMEIERNNNLEYDNLTVGTTTTDDYQGYGCRVITVISYLEGSAISAESVKQITVSVYRPTDELIYEATTLRADNAYY